MALGIHILTHTLTKFMNIASEDEMELIEGDIPNEISQETYEIADAIINYFKRQREILNKVIEINAI